MYFRRKSPKAVEGGADVEDTEDAGGEEDGGDAEGV